MDCLSCYKWNVVCQIIRISEQFYARLKTIFITSIEVYINFFFCLGRNSCTVCLLTKEHFVLDSNHCL